LVVFVIPVPPLGGSKGSLYASLMTIDDARLRRLRFRAWHRGFREADLILGPFADAYAGTLAAEQLDRLEALMEEPDGDIYDWITMRAETPAGFDHDVDGAAA
jgi:antitoxin CptB